MKKLVIILLLSLSIDSYCQLIATRLEANYSIKEIAYDGSKSLILGKVFFNSSVGSLTHSQTFPKSRLIVFKDTMAISVEKDSLMLTSSSEMSIKFSIYNLILNNHISDFGLEELGFELSGVTSEGDKVISKWNNPSANSGYVIITQKGSKVDGVIFYKANGDIAVKQFFRDYEKVGRVFFPTRILEIVNTPLGENKKVTIHKSIKIDDFTDEDELYNLYNHSLSKLIRTD